MELVTNGSGHLASNRNVSWKGDTTHVELVLDDFCFGRGSDKLPIAKGRSFVAKVDALNFRLGNPVDVVRAVIELPDSETPDVSGLGVWIAEALGL